jgi:hypothetical protein
MKDYARRHLPDSFVAPPQPAKRVMVEDLPATDRAHGLVRCPWQKQIDVMGHPSLHNFSINFAESGSMEADKRLLYIILPIR